MNWPVNSPNKSRQEFLPKYPQLINEEAWTPFISLLPDEFFTKVKNRSPQKEK